jgi:hypothetical protein
MAVLLTYAEQLTIKPISTSKFAQIEKEVEEFELRRLLGAAFLQDIQAFTGEEQITFDGQPVKYVITNSDLINFVYTLNHNKNTTLVDVTLFDNNGVKQSNDGMLRVNSANQIQINFSAAIVGSWTLIFRYWYE